MLTTGTIRKLYPEDRFPVEFYPSLMMFALYKWTYPMLIALLYWTIQLNIALYLRHIN